MYWNVKCIRMTPLRGSEKNGKTSLLRQRCMQNVSTPDLQYRHFILPLVSYFSLILWKVHQNLKFWSLSIHARSVVILIFYIGGGQLSDSITYFVIAQWHACQYVSSSPFQTSFRLTLKRSQQGHQKARHFGSQRVFGSFVEYTNHILFREWPLIFMVWGGGRRIGRKKICFW